MELCKKLSSLQQEEGRQRRECAQRRDRRLPGEEQRQGRRPRQDRCPHRDSPNNRARYTPYQELENFPHILNYNERINSTYSLFKYIFLN